MFLSFRRQAEKAALPCKLGKTTTKTTKLVICYQSNAWRRYSQILIWKCIFPFSSLTRRCSHKKADSTVMDLLSAEIWRKSFEKETTAWTSYFKDPFCVFPTTTADIPRVKCWYISDLNSTHFSGEEEKRTWKRGQNLNALAKNDSRYVGKGGPKRVIVAKLDLLQVNLS